MVRDKAPLSRIEKSWKRHRQALVTDVTDTGPGKEIGSMNRTHLEVAIREANRVFSRSYRRDEEPPANPPALEASPELKAPSARPDEARWSVASLKAKRQFGQTHARLFPLIGRRVSTPQGVGVLLSVYAELCEVHSDGSERTIRVRSEDVRLIQ
jgi:hypothetical protein